MAKKPTHYRVEISRAWRDPDFPDFLYKPGTEITADAAVLERMKAEAGLVTHAVAAD